MSYACYFLWRADYIEVFKWRLHFQFGVAIWRVFFLERYIKGQIAFARHWRLHSWILVEVGVDEERSTLRATSHTRMKTLDHCHLKALIGREGGDCPSSLHTRKGRPKGHKKTSWMKSPHGVLHGGLWIRCHKCQDRQTPQSNYVILIEFETYYIKSNPLLFFCQQSMQRSCNMIHSHFTLSLRAHDYIKRLSQHPWYGL